MAPIELCEKLMAAAQAKGAKLVIGTVQGVGLRASPSATGGEVSEVKSVIVDGAEIAADAVVVTMGPWAACAEDWFGLKIPITGVKSTSLTFASATPVAPFALFCGEDEAHGTHLEVYPRTSGEVYLCGLGGSEYVTPERLRAGE